MLGKRPAQWLRKRTGYRMIKKLRLVEKKENQDTGMFGESSTDTDSFWEIAAWKRADEHCTYYD